MSDSSQEPPVPSRKDEEAAVAAEASRALEGGTDPSPVPEPAAEPSPRRRLRLPGRRTLLRLLGAAAVLWLGFWYILIPYPWTLRTRNPDRTALMEQRIREAGAAGEELDILQEWVPLDEISSNLVRAVLVAEDHRFREHGGIDWTALAEEVRWTGDDSFSWRSSSDLRALRAALGYVWSNRSEIRGRSTLTQQLAKNLYFGTDRSLLRKALEFVVARRLEKRLGKDRILELYLNVAEWGPGIFGAEAAARTYFGRSASSLTRDQAAALAGTLPHPLTSNPSRNPRRMLWRKALILDRLNAGPGVPSTPLPLPDIAVELPPLSVPEMAPLVPSSDTARGAVPPDTSGTGADTLTLPGGGSPADSTTPLPVPPDTAARDTLGTAQYDFARSRSRDQIHP